MSDVSSDEGGGNYPPYQEDFFQRIVRVNWKTRYPGNFLVSGVNGAGIDATTVLQLSDTGDILSTFSGAYGFSPGVLTGKNEATINFDANHTYAFAADTSSNVFVTGPPNTSGNWTRIGPGFASGSVTGIIIYGTCGQDGSLYITSSVSGGGSGGSQFYLTKVIFDGSAGFSRALSGPLGRPAVDSNGNCWVQTGSTTLTSIGGYGNFINPAGDFIGDWDTDGNDNIVVASGYSSNTVGPYSPTASFVLASYTSSGNPLWSIDLPYGSVISDPFDPNGVFISGDILGVAATYKTVLVSIRKFTTQTTSYVSYEQADNDTFGFGASDGSQIFSFNSTVYRDLFEDTQSVSGTIGATIYPARTAR